MHYLYKITNIIDGRVYIGQSNKETERWRQHKYFARKNPVQYIHHAMVKHGIDNFIYEVIVMCRTSEDANYAEVELIKQYNSRNKEFGYNLAPGGETPWNLGLPKELNPLTGVPRSEETRKKISESNMGKIMPPCSEERKKKMSDKYIGRTLPEEWKNKIGEGNTGKIRSEETIKKLSISHTGKIGESASNCKINWKIVDQIREEYATGNFSQRKLAVKYNLSQSHIKDIINNKIWKR